MRRRIFAHLSLPAVFAVLARVFFLVALVCRAGAQDSTPSAAQNAADAEKAYQRGLVAADQQAWDVASSNFLEAWKKSPRETRYLYSLGLANAEAGRDIAGAAWLRAYLEASPAAANAPAVRAEIARLEDAADSNFRMLLSYVGDAYRKMP